MKLHLKLLGLVFMIWLCLLTDSNADNQFEQIFEFVTTVTNDDTALAFWIEDTSGTYKHTVYVTLDVAKFLQHTYRPSILPVWAHRRRVPLHGTGLFRHHLSQGIIFILLKLIMEGIITSIILWILKGNPQWYLREV